MTFVYDLMRRVRAETFDTWTGFTVNLLQAFLLFMVGGPCPCEIASYLDGSDIKMEEREKKKRSGNVSRRCP